MNPLDWFQFIREFLHWDAERQAAFATGFGLMLAIGAVLFFLYLRFSRRRSRGKNLQKEIHSLKLDLKTKEENLGQARQEEFKQKFQCQTLTANLSDLTNKNRQLEEEKCQLKTKKNEMLRAGRTLLEQREQLRKQVDKLEQEWEEADEKNADLASSRQDLADRLTAMQKQIQEVIDLEGKIWERPVAADVPEFRPLLTRKVPIVAVANLKGGVGKTTITANLGATLWAQGQRVLLVDLDYQGSLTSLCLNNVQINDLQHGQRLVHRLFENDNRAEQVIHSCLTRIGESKGFILAAGAKLEDAEMEAQTRWLFDPNYPDIRFTLRHWLHLPEVTKDFDVILLDCPPRWTTAAINALPCCDYVIIPVHLQPLSSERVPPFLNWLKHLKSLSLCPQLSVLGVVANRAHFYGQNLRKDERQIWEALPGRCQDIGGEPVYLFHTILKEDRELATLPGKASPVFQDLVQEICRRIKDHESSRVAILR